MDLITHIPGIANSALFTPGPNTTPPWNVAHTGLTDGTSPNNATKNMAEIYNRFLLERAAIIQKAGLTIDNQNWVQLAEAIEALIASNPNLAQVINNTYIGPQPTTQRAFTGGLVLADMPAMGVEATLQTIIFTGARRVSINAHASFKNENTTTSVNITQRMKLNGADVFGGHFLGASLPAMTNAGINTTQIPISISDYVYGLNPALTYTLSLHATRQSNVGPLLVLDSYIGIEFI